MASTRVAKLYRGMTERDRLIEGERMLERYNNGATVSKLMEEFSYRSHNTIKNRLNQAIKDRIAPEADMYREAQNALLDDSMAKVDQSMKAVDILLKLAITNEDAAGIERGVALRLKVLDSRTRIAERRARLMGLDAPARVEASVTVTTPVDAAVEELSQKMRERSDTRT